MEQQGRSNSSGDTESVAKTPQTVTESYRSASLGPAGEAKTTSSAAKPKHKVSIACEACRRKRRKCDGQTPCTACFQSRISCIYHAERDLRRQRPTRDTINELNMSQRVLDGLIKAIQSGQEAPYLVMIRSGATMEELAAALLQEADEASGNSDLQLFGIPSFHPQAQYGLDDQLTALQPGHGSNHTIERNERLDWLPYLDSQPEVNGLSTNIQHPVNQNERPNLGYQVIVEQDGDIDRSLWDPSLHVSQSAMDPEPLRLQGMNSHLMNNVAGYEDLPPLATDQSLEPSRQQLHSNPNFDSDSPNKPF